MSARSSTVPFVVVLREGGDSDTTRPLACQARQLEELDVALRHALRLATPQPRTPRRAAHASGGVGGGKRDSGGGARVDDSDGVDKDDGGGASDGETDDEDGDAEDGAAEGGGDAPRRAGIGPSLILTADLSNGPDSLVYERVTSTGSAQLLPSASASALSGAWSEVSSNEGSGARRARAGRGAATDNGAADRAAGEDAGFVDRTLVSAYGVYGDVISGVGSRARPRASREPPFTSVNFKRCWTADYIFFTPQGDAE